MPRDRYTAHFNNTRRSTATTSSGQRLHLPPPPSRVTDTERAQQALSWSPHQYLGEDEDDDELNPRPVIFYLDDILVLASTLLHQLGFKRNVKKCRLIPSQLFPYLGLEWHTLEMQVSHPHTKLNEIRRMIATMLTTPTVTARDCMILLGKMNFAVIALPLARLHCRPLQFCLPSQKDNMRLMDSQMTLTEEARDSLRRWAPPLSNGRSLINHLPTHVITIDASMTGWGAQMNDMSIQGLWTDTRKWIISISWSWKHYCWRYDAGTHTWRTRACLFKWTIRRLSPTY